MSQGVGHICLFVLKVVRMLKRLKSFALAIVSVVRILALHCVKNNMNAKKIIAHQLFYSACRF